MEDIVFHVAVGVKNDGLSQDAGETLLATMIQEQIETAVLSIPWVTDMLISKES